MEVLAGIVFLGFIGLCFFILFKVYQTSPAFIVKILNYGLLASLIIVFSIVSVGLGFRTSERGNKKFKSNLNEVKQIWGGEIIQHPPAISYKAFTTVQRNNWKTGKPYNVMKKIKKSIKIKESDISVRIDRDIRKKGLHLYNGYIATFKGKYIIKNPLKEDKTIYFHLPLPGGGNNISKTTIRVNGKRYEGDQKAADGLDWKGKVLSRRTVTVVISYQCQGLDSFLYALNVVTREIPKFKMTINTDFSSDEINYFANSMVHAGISEGEERSTIRWEAENLITRQPVSVSFNTGNRVDEIVSNLYFHSPLAICLFIGILLVFSIAYDVKLHFMHFLFFGLGFLFFYLFLSYIVSYTGILPGFFLSMLLSGSMLLYYARILDRGDKLVHATGLGLFMFQMFFSFAFYFPLHTGFIILLGSAVTLIVIMRATAGIEWKGKF